MSPGDVAVTTGRTTVFRSRAHTLGANEAIARVEEGCVFLIVCRVAYDDPPYAEALVVGRSTGWVSESNLREIG